MCFKLYFNHTISMYLKQYKIYKFTKKKVKTKF